MKKISVIIVLFMFSIVSLNISNFTFKVSADELETGIVFSDENVIVKQLEKTEIYEKIEITYRDSGEVEYLETFVNFNAEPTYKATSSNGEVNTVQKVDDVVYMDGEVVAEVSKIEELNISADSLKTENSKATWRKMGSYRTNSNVKNVAVTTIAGIIASVVGGPVTGVITSIASGIYSLAVSTIYYDIQQYVHNTTHGLAKNEYKVYRYSNYTSLIGSGSSQFYYTWS